MLHVYLDHHHWIRLAQAQHRNDTESDYGQALTIIEESARLGFASFPLSAIHHMEIVHRRDEGSRKRLASTMSAISRYMKVCQVHEVVPMELDRALRKRFGRPLEPRAVPIFGVGADHALGNPGFREHAVSYVPEGRPELSLMGRQLFLDMVEEQLIKGPDWDLTHQESHTGFRKGSRSYQDRELALVEWFRRNKFDQHDREIMLAMHTLQDIAEQMTEALNIAGIGAEEFEQLGPEGLLDFLADLPSRDVEFQVRAAHHNNPALEWKEGHLADLGSLCIGIPYCEVMVTEKLWADLAIRRGLPEKYETAVFSRISDLSMFLAAGVG